MSEEQKSNNGNAAEVVVEDLHKSFGDNAVLCGVNLRVAPREICVVMGGSGSGKSVLLRHIIGLEKPDRGRVLVAGCDVSDPEARKTLNLAMVFQSAALFNSMTVAENIGLWLEENHTVHRRPEIQKIVGDTLHLLGLKDIADQIPAELSGGMRKRVAIARALVMHPNLVLYDEPTAELDPIRGAKIGEIIFNLKNQIQVTSIVVSHDRDLALAIADHIALLHEGQIIEHGTPEEVLASTNPVVKEFLNAGHAPAAKEKS